MFKIILITLIAITLGFAALTYNFLAAEPVRMVFAENRIMHWMFPNACAKNLNFSYLQKEEYPFDYKERDHAFEFLHRNLPASAPSATRGSGMHGGGGVDTMVISAPGYIDIDGQRIQSVEQIKIRNQVENSVFILTTGIEELERDTIVIFGDADLDTVYIDGCLKMSNPQLYKPSGSFAKRWRIIVEDNIGAHRNIFIDYGMKIKRIPASDINEWFSLYGGIEVAKIE